MNVLIQNLSSLLQGIIVICAIFGALYAFLRGRKDETVKIQQNTITALKDQIDAIDKKLKALEEDNMRLKQTIETIQVALRQKGIHVTIDGDMVVIEQKEHTKTSVIRRPRVQTPSASTPDKQEE